MKKRRRCVGFMCGVDLKYFTAHRMGVRIFSSVEKLRYVFPTADPIVKVEIRPSRRGVRG